jgi:hypothetical protein
MKEDESAEHHHFERAAWEAYTTILLEPSRPPSRGGNTSALHQHRLTNDGQVFSFRARGARTWVFKNDLVSSDWDWDATMQYRNIIPETLMTFDKSGVEVKRADRRAKPKLRTAVTRMRASRSEQRD